MSTEIEIARLDIDLLVLKEKIISTEQHALRMQLKILNAERLEVRKAIKQKSNQLELTKEPVLPF